MQKKTLARLAVMSMAIAAAAAAPAAPPPEPPKAMIVAAVMDQAPIYIGTEGRRPRPGPDLPESDPRLPQMPTVPNFTGEQR